VSRQQKIGALVAVLVSLALWKLGVLPTLILGLAVLGTPLFAVMGGASELAWLRHADASMHHFRFIAPRVLEEHFAGSPILVTIPLFTFVGYVLARAKTAERLVRFSTALIGWVPGGLAIVCVLTSAFFTLLTGGSGVTIIAIGGLLLPALKKEGYSDKFSVGLLTSGGSLGLVAPFAIPLFVYAILAGVDVNAAMVAVIPTALLVLLGFVAFAMYTAQKEGIPRRTFDARELWQSFWELKWELAIFPMMASGIVVFQLGIDELAGVIAFYTVLIEVFVYKDISLRKDVPKVAKDSMIMAGAVILILTMANALVNYVINEQIPNKVFEFMVSLGLDQRWQFLIIMNIFLLLIGMVMEGFSAIFVAVPLIIPFAARFHLGPFHLGMILLLNLELAFCMPPLGLNLFIASFRFNRSTTSLYRPILPFLGLLAASLLIVSYVPSLSSVMVQSKIAKEREKALAHGEAPRDAWKLECVQEDTLNPKPCTPEDEKKYPDGKLPIVEETTPKPAVADAGPSAEADGGSEDLNDILMQMMAKVDGGAASAAEAGTAPAEDSNDDIMQQMLKPKGAPSSAPTAP
jgi:C4-dicarboxylate transporter, DctM subunit